MFSKFEIILHPFMPPFFSTCFVFNFSTEHFKHFQQGQKYPQNIIFQNSVCLWRNYFLLNYQKCQPFCFIYWTLQAFSTSAQHLIEQFLTKLCRLFLIQTTQQKLSMCLPDFKVKTLFLIWIVLTSLGLFTNILLFALFLDISDYLR